MVNVTSIRPRNATLTHRCGGNRPLCIVDAPEASFSAQSPTPVVVYVRFDKTGSTTIHHVLMRRAAHLGWPKLRYDCVCARGAPNITSRICTREFAGADYCLSFTPPKGTHVIADKQYGLCERVRSSALRDGQTPRPCHYLSTFREPIARLVSSYNYFCVACSERNRKCPMAQRHNASGAFRPSCPNITLSQYAEVYRQGNYYSRVLLPTNWQRPSEAGWAASWMGGNFTRALQARLHSTVVLITEHFSEDLTRLASILDDQPWPHSWTTPHHHAFSEKIKRGSRASDNWKEQLRCVDALGDDERQLLSRLLGPDLELYALAVNVAQEQRASWKISANKV